MATMLQPVLSWLLPGYNGSPPRTTDSPAALPLRILTHNIRYATSTPFKNEKLWEDRLPLILNELRYNTRFLDSTGPQTSRTTFSSTRVPSGTAFICLQEALHSQPNDILRGLNGDEASSKTSTALPTGPFWAHIGVAREDGAEKGEYSPIIFAVQIFHLLHYETLWLSPTPDRPSLGWDAGSIRIVTIGVFEHRVTRQRIVACNTHLDNDGGQSRKKGVAIILDAIKRIRSEWKSTGPGGSTEEPAVFLAGDFNSFPDQEAYLETAASGLMVDLFRFVEPKKRYGESITFTGFEPHKHKEEQGRIDFIWLGPQGAVQTRRASEKSLNWQVEGYAVLPNLYEDGVFSSDHRCVVGDVVLTS
ncbi:hypothetical protein B0A49_12990 [Cryomyces minteri]|uniref:Endonuclease/exonuclease/phosphatase domain-containing protein n=1 Tax=Cryomyces minteri TaxID=331657 RepID=A0A4U0V1Q9_9PEZI|nr:hypothetical protein B0A49_12990 [Cryomyces minteri]